MKDLPDVYIQSLRVTGPRAEGISDKSQVPMLRLICNTSACHVRLTSIVNLDGCCMRQSLHDIHKLVYFYQTCFTKAAYKHLLHILHQGDFQSSRHFPPQYLQPSFHVHPIKLMSSDYTANSCNMDMRNLPNLYAQSLVMRTIGPRAEGM